MNGTLVDTNILIDLFQDDARWADWSEEALRRCSEQGPLFINPIVYAEASVSFLRIEELEEALDIMELEVLPLPREALFLAGKAFLAYRRRGGAKTAVLADHLIGAHAAVQRLQLLTRDRRGYGEMFPTVRVAAYG